MKARGGSASPVVGVVLAAGDGVRMGGSKALLLVGGAPLAALHAQRLREGGCDRVVVAVRPEVARKLGALEGTCLVASSAADPAGSLAVAVREGDVGSDAVVVITPVDAAPAARATIERLLAKMGSPGALAVTPRRGDRGGHPVVCAGTILEPFRGEGTPPPLRDVLRLLGDRRVYLDVDDPEISVDLDTPEDLRAWTGERATFGGR